MLEAVWIAPIWRCLKFQKILLKIFPIFLKKWFQNQRNFHIKNAWNKPEKLWLNPKRKFSKMSFALERHFLSSADNFEIIKGCFGAIFFKWWSRRRTRRFRLRLESFIEKMTHSDVIVTHEQITHFKILVMYIWVIFSWFWVASTPI